jgi:hypothetical protein
MIEFRVHCRGFYLKIGLFNWSWVWSDLRLDSLMGEKPAWMVARPHLCPIPLGSGIEFLLIRFSCFRERFDHSSRRFFRLNWKR